jgi:hypothetical protein
VQRGEEALPPELWLSPSLGYSADLEGTPPRHRARSMRARVGEVATGSRPGEALRHRRCWRSAPPLEDVGDRACRSRGAVEVSRGSTGAASAGANRRAAPLLPLLLLRVVEGGKKLAVKDQERGRWRGPIEGEGRRIPSWPLLPRTDEQAAPPPPPRRSPTRTEERVSHCSGPAVALLSNARHGEAPPPPPPWGKLCPATA